MPRSKKGVTRKKLDANAIKSAIDDIVKGKVKLREAARKYSIPLTTLQRHVKRYKTGNSNNEYEFQPGVNNQTKLVFNEEEEVILVSYLKLVAKMHYGMSLINVRKLAFQFAEKNSINYPKTWDENETAGEGWLRCFMKRHPDLSLRKPEATSLARAAGFNPFTVAAFFDNLIKVHEKYSPFVPDQIYNIDETGVTTVQVPSKVISPTGIKQLGVITSQERGQLVTLICAINAIGNSIPPALIFPRVHFKPHMIRGAPTGSLGLTNPSGWSNEALFLKYLDHFIKHAKPSSENKVLIIFDNHESHVSLNVIEKCRGAGIVLLTLPPHTSNHLQPLDVSVFGPFKKFYNAALNDWMKNHPGTPCTIYDLAELVGISYPSAFSTKNVMSGFKNTGIFPLNRNVFDEHEDFLACAPTDRPNPLVNIETTTQTPTIQTPTTQTSISNAVDSVPSTSSASNSLPSTSNSKRRAKVSPEEIRPLPKACTRTASSKGRKRGKTCILTMTPEKPPEAPEKAGEKKPKKAPMKRKLLASSEESDEDECSDQDCLELPSSIETEEFSSDEENELKEITFTKDVVKPKTDDFVLVEFDGKKGPCYYVGKVISELANFKFKISFMRRNSKNWSFYFPQITDECIISQKKIKMILETSNHGTTARQKRFVSFNLQFSSYKIDLR